MHAIDENVILLDDANQECGIAEKLEAHRLGLRHRAFSIFLVDDDGRILLQRRAATKYHSAGLWANTCCGHPRPGEDTRSAAERRLNEEMGVASELSQVGAFLYRASVGSDLIEHEYDYVFIGALKAAPQPNPDEVMDWRWVDESELRAELLASSSDFAVWLAPALDVFSAKAQSRNEERSGGTGD